MLRRTRWLAGGLLALLALWLVAGWATVRVVTAPRPCAIEPIATLAGADVTDVSVVAEDGVELRGWLVLGSARRLVVVMPGIGGDRRSFLGLARHYVGRGRSVLLPDLRGTGESDGDRIGLGYPERLDVRAWIEFARARGFVDIGLHGQSLGAAAIAYSGAASVEGRVTFVVLDSCYDDVRNALANRLPWVPWPGLLLKPVEWFGSAALDVGVEDLRPAAQVRAFRSPTLILAGDSDTKVRLAETERLFAACGSPHKRLDWIPGAGHTNLWSFAPDDYASVLDEWLATVEARSAPHDPRAERSADGVESPR